MREDQNLSSELPFSHVSLPRLASTSTAGCQILPMPVTSDREAARE